MYVHVWTTASERERGRMWHMYCDVSSEYGEKMPRARVRTRTRTKKETKSQSLEINARSLKPSSH